MLYVQRDAEGRLTRVEEVPFEGMQDEVVSTAEEVIAWRKQQATEANLRQLLHGDLEMIRVLEDLIQVLIDKGTISFTDLPAAAQSKLVRRIQARESLDNLQGLINDQESGLI